MNRLLVCLALMSLAMLGCGADSEPEATTAAQAAKPPATAPGAAEAPTPGTPVTPAAPPEDPTARMARAVGNGKPGAAVDIRYEFAAKPSVGASTELQIALIPSAGVDSMDVTIAGMDGITLSGPLTANFEGVEAGKPYVHTVSVLPGRSGVYYVTVSVTTQIGGQGLGRTFSIPFVVGNVPAQQKPEPPKDASGQPIEPMKAEETRR